MWARSSTRDAYRNFVLSVLTVVRLPSILLRPVFDLPLRMSQSVLKRTRPLVISAVFDNGLTGIF